LAEITHPFHPLFRQHFQVLKARTVHGVECLVLKGSPAGTFSVRKDWTSLRPCDAYQDAQVSPRILDWGSLLQLVEQVQVIRTKNHDG
jgi:hypothetical protein